MTKLFIGNWKMYLRDDDAAALARVYAEAADACEDWDVAAAPSPTALERVARELADSGVQLTGQDGFWEEQGAYTGEVSMAQLADLGAELVLAGHSERREFRGVTDAQVAAQVAAASRHGLTAVICVGETAEERAAGRAADVVRRQVETAVLGGAEPGRIMIAYEPRWAIGSGKACDPDEAAGMHRLVRGILTDRYGAEAGREVRILYGGSVHSENIGGYIERNEIDGVLVGGASTKPEEVRSILCA